MTLFSIIASILCAAAIYTAEPISDIPVEKTTIELESDSKPVYGISVDKPEISYVRSLSSTRLQIKWQITAGADSYRIYRSSSKNGVYKKIAVIGNCNKTTYTDKNLSPNQTYFYRIQAFNNINNRNGYGKQSAKVSGKTLSKTNLYSVKQISKQKWELKWKKVSGADGYEIARATKKKGKFQVIKQVSSGKTLSYTDNTPKSGKRYYYKIRAIRTSGSVTGYGNYSKAVTDGSIMLNTDWKITQYGDNNGKQSMFYTIQDTKGHLIVIDGGWPENADMVKKTIARQGSHVDAWFLTHPHEDHIGAFCAIYETPGNISIDKIYAVKMASPKLCLANAPWDNIKAYKKFRSLNIRQLTYVHSGDIIKVKKLKIEILSAYEKKIDDISSDLLNDGSMLFKVYGREESMLFCADVGKRASDYVKKKYGNKLKSEYLQMGHHGNGGLKKDFYKLVNPDVTFFDAPTWLMKNRSGNYTTSENRKYMEKMGSSVVSFSTAPNTVILK